MSEKTQTLMQILTAQDAASWLKTNCAGGLLTWAGVRDFARGFSHGNSQVDYFHLQEPLARRSGEAVWDGAHWIAVWWTPGGSEGYYIHIDRRVSVPGEQQHGTRVETAALGKVWDATTAASLCQHLQQLINLAA